VNPELLAVRKRLLEDFSFYAPNALKIRTKDAKIVPFKANVAQTRLQEIVEQQYATLGRVRIIILKARQMGLSTWVGGRLYSRVSQRPAKKALVVTHEGKATDTLFEMTRRFHELCPEALKPSTRYAGRRDLKFGVLDSGYAVATAGGDTVARGETITHAHLSEVAFWPKSSSQEIFSGLMDAVPKTPDTEVYIESTANGVSGVFYDQWKAAVAGESEFIPVFLPWFIDPTYRIPVPDGFARTPEEESLCETYLLDDEQLVFRRLKIAEKGRDLWMQEYPSCPEEAFLTTGRPVFDPQRVQALQLSKSPALRRLAFEGDKFAEHSRGELTLYRDIKPFEQYFIGADVGAGVKRDWSVAQVLDPDLNQVATFRAQIDPDYYAHALNALGKLFNGARIIVEANNHGLLTVTRLAKDLAYPNVYCDEVVNKDSPDEPTRRLGFNTNVSTKPFIIDKLRAELRSGGINIVDETTLDEMRTYIVTESGKLEAEKGCHDDAVMSLALANHIAEKRWVPVSVDDSWYVSFQE